MEVLTGKLFRLATEYKRRLAAELAGESWALSAGFRPPCIGVLRMIDDQGPVSQREISDHLGVDASDLVAVLDILEDAELIDRRRDPTDRRRNAVVVTPEGRKAAARLNEVMARAEADTLAPLDDGERRTLAELLGKALGD